MSVSDVFETVTEERDRLRRELASARKIGRMHYARAEEFERERDEARKRAGYLTICADDAARQRDTARTDLEHQMPMLEALAGRCERIAMSLQGAHVTAHIRVRIRDVARNLRSMLKPPGMVETSDAVVNVASVSRIKLADDQPAKPGTHIMDANTDPTPKAISHRRCPECGFRRGSTMLPEPCSTCASNEPPSAA